MLALAAWQALGAVQLLTTRVRAWRGPPTPWIWCATLLAVTAALLASVLVVRLLVCLPDGLLRWLWLVLLLPVFPVARQRGVLRVRHHGRLPADRGGAADRPRRAPAADPGLGHAPRCVRRAVTGPSRAVPCCGSCVVPYAVLCRAVAAVGSQRPV
ncbi:hypothetical protein GCM10010174_15810 [Kutzneria viridogrisea]